MKHFKKFLSFFLCVVMVIGLLPTAVFAANEDIKVSAVGRSDYWTSNFNSAWSKAKEWQSSGLSVTITMTGSGLTGMQEISGPGTNPITIDMHDHRMNGNDEKHTLVVKEGTAVIIRNATIMNGGGWRQDGGGVHMEKNSKVTMINTVVRDNYADCGGGVYMDENCELTLIYSHIRNNKVDDAGAGVFMYGNYGKVNMSFSSIESNDALYSGCDGGGIYITADYCTVNMDDESSVRNNHADDEGGGIYINSERVTVSGGTVENNRADDDGGGIYINNDSNLVFDMKIRNNTAAHEGGAIHLYDESNTISNCVLTGNKAVTGGAIYDWQDNNALANCVITGNTATGERGGGVYVDSTVDIALSGKMIIKDNHSADSRYRNLFLQNSIQHAYAHGSPASNSEIWVGMNSGGEGVVNNTKGAHNADIYFSDDPAYYVKWDWNQETGSGTRTLLLVRGSKPAGASLKILKPDDPERLKIVGTYAYTGANGMRIGTGKELIRGVYGYPDTSGSNIDHSAVFYYSDGMFHSDSSFYNNNLATMSLNLAMAACGTNAGEDRDYTNRGSSVNQLLYDIGCENIYISDSYTVKPEQDSIGVAIASKEMELDGKAYTLVPVAIRGANYESEWASNAKVGTTGEHNGFAEAADQVAELVEQYIAEHNIDTSKVKFWVVGFSRAGATANLTSYRLTKKYGEAHVYGYDFEAPKGGLPENQPRVYANIHNCINNSDIVTRVGTTEMGFIRYGVDHYVPGDATANAVPTKSEKNQIYSDNSYLNIDNSYGSDYYWQRVKMLVQLKAITPDIVFDDYVNKASIYLFWGAGVGVKDTISERSDGRLSDLGAWEDEFLRRIQAWGIQGFETEMEEISYSQTNKKVNLPREHFVTSKPTYSSYTTQEAVRLLLRMFMSKNSDERTALLNAVSVHANLDGIGFGNIWDIYTEALDEWYELPAATQVYYSNVLWNKLIASDGKTDCVADHLTVDELSQLREAWPTLIALLFQILSYDYDATGESLDTMGTLAYNAGAILQAHTLEVNLAWLRSYDNLYVSEMTRYEVDHSMNNNFNAEVPTVTFTKAENGQQIEADGTTVRENDDLSVELESASGGMIYYALVRDSGGVPISLAGNKVYQGKIALPLVDGGSTYILTTYMRQFGRTSPEAQYIIEIKDTRHVLTIQTGNDKQEIVYKEGDTVTVTDAKTPADKRFVGWTAEGTIVDDSALKKEVVSFTMPNRDVTLTANYGDKIGAITLGLTAPIWTPDSENTLANTATVTGDGVAENTTVAISWLKGDNSPAGSVIEPNTTYIALATLPALSFANSVEVTIDGNKTNIDINQADGTLQVFYVFPATDKITLTSIPNVEVSSERELDKAKAALPATVIVQTNGGRVTADVTWQTENLTIPEAGINEIQVKGTITLPDNVKLGDGASLEITATITLAEAGVTAAPTANLTSGTVYTEEQTLKLSAAADAIIYYTLTDDGTEPENPTTDSRKYLENGIVLSAVEGRSTIYTIKMIAKKADGSETASSVVTLVYTVKPTHPLTISYMDANRPDIMLTLGGSDTALNEQTHQLLKGEAITLFAPAVENERFIGWYAGDKLESSDVTYTVTMGTEALSYTAKYIPVISKIELELDAPKAGTPLASAVNSAKITVTNEYTLISGFTVEGWTPSVEENAAYNTTYSVQLKFDPDNAKFEDSNGNPVAMQMLYAISDSVIVTVNGAPATLDEATSKIYYTFAATGKPKLLSVAKPVASYSAENKSSWDKIADSILPKTLGISVEGRSVTEASVAWAKPEGFSETTLESQELTVSGTLILPDSVSNADNVPMTVSTKLYVAAAPRASMPIMSPDATVYIEAQTVTLTTATQGAAIYYTTDGSNPTASSILYDGTPIEVAATTTIKAIAVMDGMRDSEIAEQTYRIITVTGISMDSVGKTEYLVDEKLDVSKTKIKVTDSEGQTTVLRVTENMVSGFDSRLAKENQELTVTYGGYQTSYLVNIRLPESTDERVVSIAVNGTGHKTSYTVGDELDTENLMILVTMADGTTQIMGVKDSQVSGFDSSTAGTKILTIYYGGQTTTYSVVATNKNPGSSDDDGGTDITTYKVIWIVDGVETVVNYEYGTNIVKPSDPTKEGYTFTGWDADIPNTMPANDLTFTATWKANSYIITWNIDGVLIKVACDYGKPIIKPVGLTKKGYTFIGWSPEIPETMPANDTTYNAIFEMLPKVTEPTVKINNNPGTKTINYGEGIKFTATATDLPEGAQIKWYVNGAEKGTGKEFTFSDAKANATITVKVVDKNGKVITDATGGEISETEKITVKAGFFRKLISFFKNLFRVNRIIAQSIDGKKVF